ncbi:STAS domain-containing protein [Nocardia sp. 2]|uniref:STAS domain-containing protein n=1 Tax=Nocardia acididurans TaxID=2802282 RepID=A0ABS1M8A8_9NOCA|nr:STAS domain-containing protein [Nocardia acididurans]MBL1076872.1 STAS domain-containing protein [Nocardia acididurans]
MTPSRSSGHLVVATPASPATTPVCRVSGDIDIQTVSEFRAALGMTLKADALVVVDLSEVTFCGVTGLRALLDAREWALDHNSSLRLVGSRCVRRLIEIAGLADEFEMSAGR